MRHSFGMQPHLNPGNRNGSTYHTRKQPQVRRFLRKFLLIFYMLYKRSQLMSKTFFPLSQTGVPEQANQGDLPLSGIWKAKNTSSFLAKPLGISGRPFPSISSKYLQSVASNPVFHESGRAGESHPHAPTEPYVTVSRHTAPVSLTLETSQSQADAGSNPVPPHCWVDCRFRRADSSPSLQPHYRTFNTTTG